MKNISLNIIFLCIFISEAMCNTNSSKSQVEYKFNWYPRIEITDNSISLPDNSRYEIYNTSGVWEDNFGNYGIMKCLVSQFINKNKEISLDGYCEAKDANNEKFWIYLSRSSYNKAGVGKSMYLFTEKKYKVLDKLECPYAAQIIEGGGVFKKKCKLSNKSYRMLENYNK